MLFEKGIPPKAAFVDLIEVSIFCKVGDCGVFSLGIYIYNLIKVIVIMIIHDADTNPHVRILQLPSLFSQVYKLSSSFLNVLSYCLLKYLESFNGLRLVFKNNKLHSIWSLNSIHIYCTNKSITIVVLFSFLLSHLIFRD